MKNALILLSVFFAAVQISGANTSIWKGTTNVKLENGLTVLLKEDHSQPLVTVQVWVNAGSVYENEKTYGLSHFLEHLIFKGTKTYPGDMISRVVETSGGNINAATSKEFTEYYIDIQKDAYKEAVRILADAMSNAVFPPEEIEKERLVVLSEIARHNDDPEGQLYDMFSDAIHKTTAYRSRVIGSETVIKNVTRDEINAYYKEFYVPNNMVLVIMGDFRESELIELIKETFGRQRGGAVNAKPMLLENDFSKADKRASKDVEHCYWVGGFLGPDITQTKDLLTADIVSSILGTGRSSRLFRILREEKQLVFSVGASYWGMKGNGVMGFSAVTTPDKEKKAADEITRIIKQFKESGPTEQEMKRAKEMSKSSWYFGNESIHGQAALMGYWYLLGNPDFIDKYVDGMEAVTVNDVKDFMNRYYREGLSTAVMVPTSK